MIPGVGFIVIGIFIYIKESFDIEIIEGEKTFNRKNDVIKDKTYRYKMLVCVFSILLGVFKIINDLIY